MNQSTWNGLHGGECNLTGQQSPIDITSSSASTTCTSIGALEAIKYSKTATNIDVHFKTNEHTWEVELINGSYGKAKITWENKDYKLHQYHFHSPSENTIDGKFFDMEMHHVHKNADGRALVLAVMFKVVEGLADDYLATFWGKFPTNTTHQPKGQLKVPYDVSGFLPKDWATNYYYYLGSFTTPPCTVDTVWLVLKEPVKISATQRDKFRSGINAISPNQLLKSSATPAGVTTPWDIQLGVDNRPVQAMGSRVVCSSKSTTATLDTCRLALNAFIVMLMSFSVMVSSHGLW